MTGEENHIPMLSRRNLNAIEDLDKRHKETHIKQKKEQFAKKLEEKFKTFDKLPEDWSLKTQIEIQINVLKKEKEGEKDEEMQPLVEQKKISTMLSYFMFTPNEQPQFLQERQNKEYLKHEL